MFHHILTVLVSGAALTALAADDSLPFRDTARPVDERVADLVNRLTLEEKAELLNHRGAVLERFQIRADQWNQCLNGVKWDRPTTLFPACLALAATWDTDLVHEVATVLSDEARAIYNGWHLDPKAPGEHKGLIYRAPVINIGRNPYWGRNHEAWGEDPHLCGRMAVAYVRGLQGDDPKHLKIAATLKHFAVNNVETDRQQLNAYVPENALREYWLPHFRDAVIEGGAQSVMASYNAINGTPNNINRWLLTDLLKGEWRHEGFVVSDLGGVRTMVQGHGHGKMSYEDAVAQSVMAGCDFSDKEYATHIPSAVRGGNLSQDRLNDAVRRVLRVRFRLGEFDPFESVAYSRIPPSVIDSAAHRAIARKAAHESIVLLKNDGVLPLDRSKLKRIAVLGPFADRVVLNNYNGKTGETISALRGIREQAGPQIEIVTDAAVADVVIVCVGTDASVEQESRDRRTLALPPDQQALVEAIVATNPRTVVVEMSAGPLAVPWIKNHVPAILQAWWSGEEGGRALADVLFGDVNPAGRLPHTVYSSDAQVPPLDQYDIAKGFTYMHLRGEPLFAFGHGLSYVSYRYADCAISGETVQVTVENMGRRAGEEVVQMYVRRADGAGDEPARKLAGFTRARLEPGERRTFSFALPRSAMARWDDRANAFVVKPGEYEFEFGGSSVDIHARTRFTIGK